MTLSTEYTVPSSVWIVGGRLHVHPAAQIAFRCVNRPLEQAQQLCKPSAFGADRPWLQVDYFLAEDLRTRGDLKKAT